MLLATHLPEATPASLVYVRAALLACYDEGYNPKLCASNLEAAVNACAAAEVALRRDAAAALRPLRQVAMSIGSKTLELNRLFCNMTEGEGAHWLSPAVAAAAHEPMLPWAQVRALLSALHPGLGGVEAALMLAVLAGASASAEGGLAEGITLAQLKQALAAIMQVQAFPVSHLGVMLHCAAVTVSPTSKFS